MWHIKHNKALGCPLLRVYSVSTTIISPWYFFLLSISDPWGVTQFWTHRQFWFPLKEVYGATTFLFLKNSLLGSISNFISKRCSLADVTSHDIILRSSYVQFVLSISIIVPKPTAPLLRYLSWVEMVDGVWCVIAVVGVRHGVAVVVVAVFIIYWCQFCDSWSAFCCCVVVFASQLTLFAIVGSRSGCSCCCCCGVPDVILQLLSPVSKNQFTGIKIPSICASFVRYRYYTILVYSSKVVRTYRTSNRTYYKSYWYLVI